RVGAGSQLRRERPGEVPQRQPQRAGQPGVHTALFPDRTMSPTHYERTGSATLNPLPATAALDAYFFEARAKLLDLAAFLDRIERGANADALNSDPRLAKIQRALEVLHDGYGGRAEQIQEIFSLASDPSWER